MKYYTTSELMALFRVSRHSIYRANLSGALPVAKKDGVQNLYSEEDVLKYLEQSGNGKFAQK